MELTQINNIFLNINCIKQKAPKEEESDPAPQSTLVLIDSLCKSTDKYEGQVLTLGILERLLHLGQSSQIFFATCDIETMILKQFYPQIELVRTSQAPKTFYQGEDEKVIMVYEAELNSDFHRELQEEPDEEDFS